MKATKILLPIIVLIASAIAIYFLAPLAAWKEKQLINVADKKTGYLTPYTPGVATYLQYCKAWWCYKFSNTTTLIIKDEHQNEYKGTTGVKELDDPNKDVLKDILS